VPLECAIERILGPAGTQVTLTILQSIVGHTRQVTLTRAKIALCNVSWQPLPGTTIAHLRRWQSHKLPVEMIRCIRFWNRSLKAFD
jgi:C-terminal processing protease CtpA/Prc